MELLEAAGSAYTERRYVDDPPTAKELDRVLTALGQEPWEIARMGEEAAKELNLEALPHDRKQWIDVMVANPILIERPILVSSDGRAALGRPPEALKDLF
jgi:arsenate reductase